MAIHAQCFAHLRADRTQRVQRRQRILRHPAQRAAAQRRVHARRQRDVGAVVRERARRAQSRRQQAEQRQRGETLAAAAFADHAEALPGHELEVQWTKQAARTDVHFELAQRQRHAAADSR